jgi:hypothetical protein
MESGFDIYAIYSPRASDICLAPELVFLQLCITSWHEQVTFSQDDDGDNNALYKSNTLSLAH